MTKPITKELAIEFFAALEENEECMGEYAAIAVTLEQFGFDNDDMDAYIELFQAHPDCTPIK